MPLLNCGAKPIALPVVKPLVREIEQPLRLRAEVFEFGHTDTATNLQRSRSQARVRVSPQQQAHSERRQKPPGRSRFRISGALALLLVVEQSCDQTRDCSG